MLNKKALEAACEVYKNSGKIPGPSRLKDAIEAYHAALPDEGEDKLVERLRVASSRHWESLAIDSGIFNEAADALEAARAKVANLSGPLEAEGTWTPKAIQAAAPEGWRLVPGRQGSVWRGNLMKLLGVPSDPLPQTLEDEAEVMIRRVLAAAPEASDDR